MMEGGKSQIPISKSQQNPNSKIPKEFPLALPWGEQGGGRCWDFGFGCWEFPLSIHSDLSFPSFINKAGYMSAQFAPRETSTLSGTSIGWTFSISSRTIFSAASAS